MITTQLTNDRYDHFHGHASIHTVWWKKSSVHQLRLVVYPIYLHGISSSQVQDVFHQQYYWTLRVTDWSNKTADGGLRSILAFRDIDVFVFDYTCFNDFQIHGLKSPRSYHFKHVIFWICGVDYFFQYQVNGVFLNSFWSLKIGEIQFLHDHSVIPWKEFLPNSSSHTLWGSVWKEPLKAFHLRRSLELLPRRSSRERYDWKKIGGMS